ncbi:MAG: CDP-alcohol phosphatidyltransferase family protein [Defluviitaleaceae bacterium]|nr:CDP-alcohol phosphatidyltransferase family protein [Defluviitaleaceae bacterium]
MTKYFPSLKHFNIPNLITTFGMVLGIFACYFLTQRDLRMAIIFLFLAGVMDVVDGFVAAKLNQVSDFGRYLDSFVDFFTCIIIPIWMVHDVLGEYPLYPLVVAGLIVYCMCGLWRLSYYNIGDAGKFFTGLPVPGSMMLVTIAIWCVVMYGIPIWVSALTFFVVGALMISGIKLPKYGIWQKVMAGIGVAFLVLVVASDFISTAY